MISYSDLGARSRFGNHLFQYAFLRTTARRLGVPFYCPRWHGDDVFCLEDEAERAAAPMEIVTEYVEPYENPGFNELALQIRDGTNIRGYFQTYRYLDREQVRGWYRFRDEKVASVRLRYAHVNFATSVGLHVRLGDVLTSSYERLLLAAPRLFQKRSRPGSAQRQRYRIFRRYSCRAYVPRRSRNAGYLYRGIRALRRPIPPDAMPRFHLLALDVLVVGRLAQCP